jgi:hypothetical protein
LFHFKEIIIVNLRRNEARGWHIIQQPFKRVTNKPDGITSKPTAKAASKIVTPANSVDEIAAGTYGPAGRTDQRGNGREPCFGTK